MGKKDIKIKNYHLALIKDKSGKHTRVWVQQMVKDKGPILALQSEISKINPNFKPERPEKLHMTLAHFGIPDELCEDFRKEKPKLTLDQFLEHFYKLLQKTDDAVKDELIVQGKKLEIFGTSPHHVAVVKIVKTPLIIQSREVIVQALRKFIRDLGISDANKFMLNSPNLQFNPDEVYQPHVTLGYVGKNTTLPQIDVSDLNMVLAQTDIGGVEKIPIVREYS